MTTTTKPTVVEAISAAMLDLRQVEKASRNEAQNYSYRSSDDILVAAAPVLRKHRIVIVPDVEQIEYAAVEYGARQTRMTSARIVVAFRWYGPNGDFITARVAAEAADNADKSATKAMTTAFRINLVEVLALPVADAAAVSPAQVKAMQTLFGQAGMRERQARLDYAAAVTGREDLTSSKDLTAAEASEVIDSLKAALDEPTGELHPSELPA